MKYQPSNGSEGMWFMDVFCDNCAHDGFRITEDPADGCDILRRSLIYNENDPRYPNEWIEDEGGKNPRCTAFVEGDDQAAIKKMEQKKLNEDEKAWMEAAKR